MPNVKLKHIWKNSILLCRDNKRHVCVCNWDIFGMVMMFHVDFWLLLADGYNLLMGICSAPLSTSHRNMSRSEQAVGKAQSDLEINLFFFPGCCTTCTFSSQRSQTYTRLQVDYNAEETHLEVKANSIMAHLTFEQIPTGASATMN